MLDWPTTLAEFHQSLGRSNRVDHEGPIYAAFPYEGSIQAVKGIYQTLQTSYRLGK